MHVLCALILNVKLFFDFPSPLCRQDLKALVRCSKIILVVGSVTAIAVS